MTLSEAIDRFLDARRTDAATAPKTVESYANDLGQFVSHTPGMGRRPLDSIASGDLEAFQIWLKKEQALEASSIARKTTAVRQLFRFCVLEGLLLEDPSSELKSPRASRALPDPLTGDQVQALLAACDPGLPYKGPLAPALQARDRLMVLVLYATGLRISELLSLHPSNLDLAHATLRVRGKGGKERLLPLLNEVAKAFADYLADPRRQLGADWAKGPLFDLSRQTFWRTLRDLALKAGLGRHVSPHQIRHTFATHLLQNGVNLRALQALLGHADLSTTQIYTHVNPEHLRQVHKRHHPRG